MQRESEHLGGGLPADRPQVSSAPLQAGALPCAAPPLSDLGCNLGSRQPVSCIAGAPGRPLHGGEAELRSAKDAALEEGSTVQSFQSCAVRGRRPTTLATFELWVAGVGAVSAAVLLVRRRALAR